MGGGGGGWGWGACFPNTEIVFTGDNDNTLSFANLKSKFSASGFFQEILTVRAFLSLFLIGIFCESAHYEKQIKQQQQQKTKKKKKKKQKQKKKKKT